MKKFIFTFLLLITGVSIYQIHAADVKGLLIGDRSVEMSIYDFVSNIKPTDLTSGTITYFDCQGNKKSVCKAIFSIFSLT